MLRDKKLELFLSDFSRTGSFVWNLTVFGASFLQLKNSFGYLLQVSFEEGH